MSSFFNTAGREARFAFGDLSDKVPFPVVFTDYVGGIKKRISDTGRDFPVVVTTSALYPRTGKKIISVLAENGVAADIAVADSEKTSTGYP